jgi:hypothetical protein
MLLLLAAAGVNYCESSSVPQFAEDCTNEITQQQSQLERTSLQPGEQQQ